MMKTNKLIPQFLITLTLLIAFSSCQQNKTQEKQDQEETRDTSAQSLAGTWSLTSSKVIVKGDTSVTFAAKDQKMIKMFNDTHFAFFTHDLKKGADSATAVFSAGSGTYSYNGTEYKEHLEFCSARGWENHDFTFTLTIKNDTLLQTGVEKIDSLNVDRIIIEEYVKEKQ